MSIAEKFEIIADEVYAKGKKDEYDKFWDAYQDYGNRTKYPSYSFYGAGFNANNFYPKYDIKPQGSCINLFYAWETTNISLKQRLEECGVKLDTSKVTSFTQAFNYSKFTELPIIDLSSMTSAASSIFSNNYGSLKTIEKLIVSENTAIGSWFGQYCQNLTNLIVEGTIAKSGFNVQYQKKLTTASLLSILKALSLNITATTTITFSTVHQSIIETDTDCKLYWEAAKNAGWSFVYA